MSIRDLHICKNSMTTKSDSEPCDYAQEYAYSDLLPEGYSSASSISWQHFPRSTSSRRGTCDASDESLKKTESQSTALPTIKEESLKSSSIEYPITKSIAQLNALHYLEIRHVYEFLNFLMSHLVCNEPNNPVEFLVELIKKCLKYRDSFGEPPLLFTNAHIMSVYAAFDPFERGRITEKQYHEAMRSLGLENSITPYNREPFMAEEGYVEQNYFLFEAERCLTENLKKMLRIPKIWEENRLLWKKKMKQLKPKSRDAEKHIVKETELLGEAEEPSKSENFSAPTQYFRMCNEYSKANCEFEQLYFN